MKTRIVPIGNSQGIRIPKPMLEQTGIAGEVEIIPENDSLVIRAVTKPRAGWAAAFKNMAECGDDSLIDERAAISQSEWDEAEWQWQ